MVSRDIADVDYKLEEWLKEQALRNGSLGTVEAEIDNVDYVQVTEETYKKHEGSLIGSEDWKAISKENRENG